MASLYIIILLGFLQLGLLQVLAEKGLERVKREGPTLVATAVLKKPFFMEIENQTQAGSDRYEGFLVDLLAEISSKTGLKFTLNVKVDNSFRGMIDELINKTADMAAGAFTITWEREQKIDMTKPFLHSGVTILMKKSDAIVEVLPPVDTSVVMKPFQPTVWVCIILAVGAVTGLFCVINRFDPNEKGACNQRDRKTKKEGERERKEELHFSILACLWMVLGSLVVQGYTKRPHSIAALVLFFVWWAFCLVIFAFYIGGILRSGIYEAATVKVAKVEAFNDLVQQDEIKFGSVKGGATYQFFKHSKFEKYVQGYKLMSANPSRMVATHAEGEERVRRGGYALLADESFVEYVSRRKPCDLMKVGALLNSFGYGFGLQKNSPHTEKINLAILELRESQAIGALWKKWSWWDSECEGIMIESDDARRSLPSRPLSMASVGGIFIMLFIGLLCTLVTMAIEIFLNRRKQAQAEAEKRNEPATLQSLTLT